jgi:beta-mannosidase
LCSVQDRKRIAPLTQFELAATGREVVDPEGLARLAELEWLPALVPGGVHESLLAAGRIEHPYFGDNAHGVRWVEERTWWYRARFAGPAAGGGERVLLDFHGLDTVASIWLNGAHLGDHASQFRPASFDVTGQLREQNELVLRFSPPLQDLRAPESIINSAAILKDIVGSAMSPGDSDDGGGESPPGVLSGDLALTLRRKGTFSWGWDFAPRLPSIGIWLPVELRVQSRAALDGHHIRAVAVDAQARTARVEVDVDVDAFAHPEPLTALLALTSPTGRRTTHRLELDEEGRFRSASARFEVTDAQLWWTHDLGASARYEVHLELVTRDGTVLDERDDRIGLRTVSLDRSADPSDGGRFFRFVLNGVPTYSRGANWIPADMMVGSVTDERCRALVDRARAANMTMLRVWGGGTYERDAFYDACDELGVLVWQDFMFACIDYPSDDPELRAEVTEEARHQVRRLRNHPCLALWCGNNEVHAIHGILDRSFAPGNWGYAFFHEILPDAVARHSPGTDYWPGSPWGEDDPTGINGVLDGDRHAWEVWHGIDLGAGGPTEFASRGEAVHFHRYAYDRGKFISEFGIHATPELSTLERWTEPGTLALHSHDLLNRNKDVPKDKGDAMMSVETGLPLTLREYLDFSMATQAEGLKFGIEHYRRRQPHNSGTLVWQLNDSWPGMSWSIIDYDLTAKAGYYFVQRAYRPVLASFSHTEAEGLRLWVTNSLPRPVTLRLRVELATFAGKQLHDERLDVTVPGLASLPVWVAGVGVETGPDRFAWVSEETGLVEANRLFFAPLRDLEFGAGRLEAHVLDSTERGATIELRSHGYQYLVRVASPAPGVSFNTNYLDLRDGDSVQIEVTGLPSGFDPRQLVATGYAGQPTP